LDLDIAKVLKSTDIERRALIVRRSDGTFQIVEQRRYQNVYEGKTVAEGWRSIPAGTSLFQSIEIAEREARLRFSWVS
jgi:hypothetical protein